MNKIDSYTLGNYLCKAFGIDPTHVMGIHISATLNQAPCLTVDYAPSHPEGEHEQSFEVVPMNEVL